ncbi:site-specific DNA-methyltransferase [Gordonia sp. PDNC005]|uniref:DNA-methyltransferase n=1 Tax=Gordonia sp. PDNC005 TaxID=2811424 RepID=UPI0019646D2C|nr:site-specific DNA-methyltransferase [Gordonia sp. PDNC005]QRY62722.1 site-specific DNA-methyltransferase [Gordonia sp. PDNC005]
MSEPYYQDDLVALHHGDCLDVLRTLPDNSVDAVVTDPPYGLEFMGKDWDAPWKKPGADVGRGVKVAEQRAGEMTEAGRGHTTSAGPYLAARVDSIRAAGAPFQEWCTEWATECLRVLKPGGHMLAFGGSRTWHRLAAAVEDAGFEIRDSIAWLYGSGFPKSMDVSKAIDKGEGIWRGRAGAVSSDNGSMSGGNYERTPKGEPATEGAAAWDGWGTALKPAFEPIVVGRKPLAGTVAATVLEYGTGALNIDGCRTETYSGGPGSTPEAVDGGRRTAMAGDMDRVAYDGSRGRWPTNVILDDHQAVELDQQSGTLTSGTMRAGTERQPRTGGTIYGADARSFTPADTYGDSGGVSRFFPVFRYQAKAATSERPNVDGVQHPTVKPIDLMRWLVRLVTPPGATVLEPFAGSGTTAEACVLENRRCIAIEREADYLPLIVSRLKKPTQGGLFDMAGGAR